MFDIAWTELLVIIVVALVVVGPKDLPRLMRTAGQWAGRARAMADQFRRSFDDIARQSELDELRSEVNRLQQSVRPDPPAEIEIRDVSAGNPLDVGTRRVDDVRFFACAGMRPARRAVIVLAVPQALPKHPSAPART